MSASPHVSDSPLSASAKIIAALRSVPNLELREKVELRHYTRFAIGGPADVWVETGSPEAFAAALRLCRERGVPHYILGDGSNVVVSDDGFRGVILRFTARNLRRDGQRIEADAGAPLQSLVDFSIECGFAGLHTLAGIPGSVGAAVYGNAGAYGNSICERIERVEYFNGTEVALLDNAGCEFNYRESIFKRYKDWMIFRASLVFETGDREALRKTADEIMALRNEKFPPTLRCAGSIFKNLHLADLPSAAAQQVPERAVRGGKVAAAYFLELVGAKGMRCGGIAIADYHANLIFNEDHGTAAELREIILDLKHRVRERFGINLEEEVQYVGF